MKKIYLVVLMGIVFVSLMSSITLADTPYRGSLHQHTGYSTNYGYDGNPDTDGDDCVPFPLELNDLGYSVAELANQADDINLDYLGFSDHSYCIDSGEFNTVKSDCNTEDANRAGFTCLMGEEVSAAEIVDDIEIIPINCNIFGIGDDGEAHVGAYGINTFISQTPTAEHCPDSPNVTSAISNINSQGGISIVNHPYSTLIGIEFLDFEGIDTITGETGIEIWNKEWDNTDQEARDAWVWDKLQGGEKVYAYGGTDEHGGPSEVNYNYVFLNSLTSSNLKSGLAAGTNVVSNNGYVRIQAKTNTQGTWTQMGGSLSANSGEMLTVRVSHDVENNCEVRVFNSEIGSNLELFYNDTLTPGPGSFDLSYPLTVTGNYYFRAECISSGGTYRTYTNPIWVDVLTPTCECTNWVAGSCGVGSCGADQRQETRSCSPSACSAETQCVFDAACSDPQEPVSDCTEPGYESCIQSGFGNCDVALALNQYDNVNNIQWGAVNDANDPYVINEYKIGWKAVDAEQTYYDTTDCFYGGCNGESLALTGTRVTVTAPGTAHREEVLGYDDTLDFWCTVWFNPFDPNFGAGNPIYVLNCFNDSDCSASQYCDKSGIWSTWSCVAEKSDGVSCSGDNECSSNYCDNDGVGLTDDGWCFTPFNTYFDGQETSFCEVSTGLGASSCDERQVGDDLNKCIGLSYREEECSSTCGETDVTSIFECTETGCSCAQSLCDGLTTGSSITTCSSGQTYFADKCTSTASGEDRTDNVCRSSAFVAGCTADSQCNGVVAGTGDCDSSCNLVLPNDTHKFNIKNSTNDVVAWLGSEGNIVLKGSCFSGGSCDNPGPDSFIIRNSTNNNVAFINSTGDLCIIVGDCSDQSASCNPTRDAFIIRNSSDYNMSYIDFDGDLCLTGTLYENSNP